MMGGKMVEKWGQTPYLHNGKCGVRHDFRSADRPDGRYLVDRMGTSEYVRDAAIDRGNWRNQRLHTQGVGAGRKEGGGVGGCPLFLAA